MVEIREDVWVEARDAVLSKMFRRGYIGRSGIQFRDLRKLPYFRTLSHSVQRAIVQRLANDGWLVRVPPSHGREEEWSLNSSRVGDLAELLPTEELAPGIEKNEPLEPLPSEDEEGAASGGPATDGEARAQILKLERRLEKALAKLDAMDRQPAATVQTSAGIQPGEMTRVINEAVKRAMEPIESKLATVRQVMDELRETRSASTSSRLSYVSPETVSKLENAVVALQERTYGILAALPQIAYVASVAYVASDMLSSPEAREFSPAIAKVPVIPLSKWCAGNVSKWGPANVVMAMPVYPQTCCACGEPALADDTKPLPVIAWSPAEKCSYVGAMLSCCEAHEDKYAIDLHSFGFEQAPPSEKMLAMIQTGVHLPTGESKGFIIPLLKEDGATPEISPRGTVQRTTVWMESEHGEDVSRPSAFPAWISNIEERSQKIARASVERAINAVVENLQPEKKEVLTRAVRDAIANRVQAQSEATKEEESK